MLLVWDQNAWDDYQWRQAQNRKVLKRINALLVDIQRNGNEGIGKPGALEHDFAGIHALRALLGVRSGVGRAAGV